MRVLSFDVGLKSLSLCLLDFTPREADEPELKILFWETVDVHAENQVAEKSKPTMKQDSEYVLNTLSSRVDALMDFGVQHIIIEQQPAGGRNMFSSVRMKILSHTIHSFFHLYQLNTSGQVTIPIEFVSPASKLKGMKFEETKEDTELRRAGDRRTMGAKYRKNKQHAVDVTTKLLADMQDTDETHEARLTFARATPKQDDLSDAFLLAYAFGVKTNTPKPTKKRKREG